MWCNELGMVSKALGKVGGCTITTSRSAVACGRAGRDAGMGKSNNGFVFFHSGINCPMNRVSFQCRYFLEIEKEKYLYELATALKSKVELVDPGTHRRPKTCLS